MNKVRKICVVIANRANYARIKSVLRAIKEQDGLGLQLIVNASALLTRFGNVSEVIQADGFEITEKVHVVIEGETPSTMAKSTGLGIIEMATAFENLKPDIVLTVADRFETMATAIAASYMNIPLAHTQGGDVTGSIDESVRHAITKLSHIHFPATEASLQRIVRLGENPELIFNVGCPSIDLILDCDLKKDPQYIVDRPIGAGVRLSTSEPFVMVLQHPVTTEYGDGIWQVEEILRAVHRLKMQTIVFWPNADAGSEEVACGIRRFREHQKDLDIFRFFINLPPEDFILLMNHAKCLVGNSSAFIREGTFLGTPVVNIGSRQSGRERGENVVDVPVNEEKIYQAIQSQIQHGHYPQNYLFGNGGSGRKISKILSECKVNIQKKLNY